MKILLLMPLDEKYVWIATAIFSRLNEKVKQVTFPMPMYMEYLFQTKKAENWTYAMFDTIVSANYLYKTAKEKNEDFILIGNCKAENEFDAVFNFQDIEEELPYKDNFLEHIQTLVNDEPLLKDTLAGFHQQSESQMSLINCTATAHFLERYIDTDMEIKDEKIKEMIKDDENETAKTVSNGGQA